MKKIFLHFAAICLFCAMMTGCYVSTGDGYPESEAALPQSGSAAGPAGHDAEPEPPERTLKIPVTNFSPSEDNRYIVPNYWPNSENTGIYIAKKDYTNVKFYDYESKQYISLCAQQGCGHQDDSCLSYQGTICEFGVYDGLWYTLCVDENQHMRFVRTDPDTNRRTTLYSGSRDGVVYAPARLMFSHGYAWFEVFAYSPDAEDQGESTLAGVNLETGETVAFASEAEYEAYRFYGSSNGLVYLVRSYAASLPMDFDTYREQNPDCTEMDYYSYQDHFLFLNTRHQLLQIDLQTMARREICENVRMGDLNCCYGDELFYRTINQEDGRSALYRLDMASGVSSLFWEDTWILNYSLLDRKVLCILRDPNEELGAAYYYVDLDTKEITVLDNNGVTGALYFGIYAETEDKFIGYASKNGHGGMSWMYKEDYWAGRYENMYGII